MYITQESTTTDSQSLDPLQLTIGKVTVMKPEQVHEPNMNGTPTEFYSHLIAKTISNLQGVDELRAVEGQLYNNLIDHNEPIEYYDPIINTFRAVLDKRRIANCPDSYNIYVKSREDPTSILEHIWNVSQNGLSSIDGNVIPWNEQLIDLSNINAIIKYIRSIPGIEQSEVNVRMGAEWFSGMVDIMTSDTIISIDLSTTLSEPANVKSIDLYIMKGILAHGRDMREIRKFIMYNPILGYTTTIHASELNYTRVVEAFIMMSQ